MLLKFVATLEPLANASTRHQELGGKLLQEAETSARQNAAVAMRWADLFTQDVP